MSGQQSAPPNPGAAQPQQPGQPPIGSSPATGATQNLGLAAKGLQAVSALLNGMAMVIPMVGPSSPIGQSLARALSDIGKHIPPGAATEQGQQMFIQNMARQQQQMATQRAAMQSQAAHAAPGGAPPGGAPPPAAAA